MTASPTSNSPIKLHFLRPQHGRFGVDLPNTTRVGRSDPKRRYSILLLYVFAIKSFRGPDNKSALSLESIIRLDINLYFIYMCTWQEPRE